MGGTSTVLFCGGRQSGKTLTGVAGLLIIILILKRTRMGISWVLTPTIDQTKTAKRSFEELAKWKKNGGIIKKYLAHELAYIIDIGGGQEYRIEFKTASEPNNLRGGRVDAILADEGAFLKEEAYDTFQPCLLASGGPLLITSTPNGLNWLYERIYLPGVHGKNPAIKVIHAKTSDNPVISGPLLLQMKAAYSDEMARQEFEAAFIHSQGLVYPMFKEEFIKSPPKHFAGDVIVGIDPGANDPFAYLWVVKNGSHFWVVDEYYSTERRTLSDHALRIKTHQWEEAVSRRWSDPARAQDNLDLQLTYGLENWKAKNDLKGGIDAVALALQNGNLFIDPYCENLIREFRSYSYKEKGEVPVDKDNHALDALRYVIMSEKNISGDNTVHIPVNGGAYAVSVDEKGYNEAYLPDGSTIGGFEPEGPKAGPGSRR